MTSFTEQSLNAALRDLPLGGLRYFERIGSTNDLALAWAAEGAPDLALVITDEQTAGRGRGGRNWYTSPEAALAFSLILRPEVPEQAHIPLFSGLGALSVAQALERYNLHPEIKWPNDVLLNRRKVCGVLAETVWLGNEVESVVLGIGLNVRAGSVPPAELLDYPAICVEDAAGKAIPRESLLHDILVALIDWRPRMGTDVFIQAWEEPLAFRGERVEIWIEGAASKAGQVEGLERDGSLRLRSMEGEVFAVHFGEVHMRLVV